MRESGITGLITQFAGMKDVVQLHGGLPPPAAFPISGVSLRLADGGSIDISDPDLVGCKILKILTNLSVQSCHQQDMTLGKRWQHRGSKLGLPRRSRCADAA